MFDFDNLIKKKWENQFLSISNGEIIHFCKKTPFAMLG